MLSTSLFFKSMAEVVTCTGFGLTSLLEQIFQMQIKDLRDGGRFISLATLAKKLFIDPVRPLASVLIGASATIVVVSTDLLSIACTSIVSTNT